MHMCMCMWHGEEGCVHVCGGGGVCVYVDHWECRRGVCMCACYVEDGCVCMDDQRCQTSVCMCAWMTRGIGGVCARVCVDCGCRRKECVHVCMDDRGV